MKEIRIGASPTLPTEAAGINLVAAENPNFVDAMTHWMFSEAYGPVAATMGLPMEFAPDPTITTSCRFNNDSGYNPSGGVASLDQDKVAIPDDMRASLPCDFTASYWRLQVGGVENIYTNFAPTIWWYRENQSLLGYATAERQTTDLHAWQYEHITATVPATAYYLSLSTGYRGGISASMYYTAFRLEREGVSAAAPTAPSFAVHRHSAGICIAVRDKAAPRFAVSRDASGLLLGVLPAPTVAHTYTAPVIHAPDAYTYVWSWDYSGLTYAAARAGTAQKQAWWGDQYNPFYKVGQDFNVYYAVFQPYLRFDTSVVPDDETVLSAVLAMPLRGDLSDTDFTIEARVYDSGDTITTADYVAGDDLAALPLFATRDTAGGLPPYLTPDWDQVVFVEAAGAAAAINKTGITGLLLCSDRTRLDVAPTGSEIVDLSVQGGGHLTITTSGPA